MHDHEDRYHGEIMMTASTGAAAFAIGGRTIDSALGFRPGQTDIDAPITGKTLTRLKKEWARVLVLVIEEVSMVSNVNLATINHTLNLIFGVHDVTNAVFLGNLLVVLVGDFAQLKPVMGRYIFKENEERINLFKLLFHPLLLTKVFRQKNRKFVLLLNRLRFGRHTKRDMVTMNKRLKRNLQWKAYKSPEKIENDTKDLARFEEALHVFPTRKLVSGFNGRAISCFS
jgi:hypothetical protein